MESLRVGGIVSGLDTNAIIDSLMAAAKEPINMLNERVSDLSFEKTIYNDFLTSLNGMKNALLPLKMESTFKSKITTSSSESVAGGAASVNTPPGSYNINVTQTAKPAFSTSIFTNKTMVLGGAGVSGIQSNVYSYDQIEGTHNVSIKKKSASQWIAKDVFESKNGQKYNKNSGADIDAALVEPNGKLISDLKASVFFGYTFNGKTQTVPVEMDYKKDTNLSVVAQDLEQKINAAIDSNYTKNAEQQFAVRAEMDETTGAFKLAFYDVSSLNAVAPIGFMDGANTGTTPSATDTLMLQLGVGMKAFDATRGFGTATETTQIISMIASNNEKNLQTKITDNQGGLFPGATLKIDAGGLTEGKFTVYQDASSNSRQASKSTYYGGKLDAAKAIVDDPDPAAPKWESAETKILKALSSTFKDNILFDTKSSEATNGFFHINGIKIEIEDYTKLSPSILMAKINGSGAGVKATFDMETRTFKVENNGTGPTKITLGQDGDTSNILSILKLNATSALYNPGQTEGSIDTTAPLNKAGFTFPIGNSGIFTINGVSIFADVTKDSVEDIISRVNKSGAGVTMNYDQTTDKFTLTAKDGTRIKVGSVSDTSSFLVAAGISYANVETEVGSVGSGSIFSVNGTKYERMSNEINDVIQGMTLNIAGIGSTVIKVEIDTEPAVQAFADFASKYNEVMNKLSPISFSDDDRARYGKRLADADKQNMNEDEIKNYEKNYNAIQTYDIIHSSPELKRLKTTVRDEVFGTVSLTDNKYRSLSSLGILTAGAGAQDITVTKLGLLLDTTTDKDELVKYLKENTSFVTKIKSDSDEVFRFFSDQKNETYLDSAGKPQTRPTEQGWSRSMDTFIVNNTTTTSAIYKKTGVNGTIERQIKSLRQQIETQTKRAESYLERMWAQFSAMEQKVQNANNQASYLPQISAKSGN